jgi:hypothetical protein
VKPALTEKRVKQETRHVKQDAWLNGPTCPTCGGTGQCGTPAPEVAGG